jgi:mannobiose 2-epimerase
MHIQQYKKELYNELENILNYWIKNTIDHQYGGFIGRIDESGTPHQYALKGSVLNARILWTFSKTYNKTKKEEYQQIAQRAFDYILSYFVDQEYGGVFWTVDYKGQPADTKKQVYALAFVIYACSEYYQCSGNNKALEISKELYDLIEQHSYDKENGGYFEAFAVSWTDLPDLRLSEKDANEKKTMNTHLHILESYSNLYKIYPDPGLKNSIENLLWNFNDYFISKSLWHFNLFFDERWQLKSETISYGHDIEAAWLLLDAAKTIQDKEMTETFSKIAIHISDAVFEAIDKDGGLWYEYEPSKGLVKEKHWWPQAEAMIGFFNSWQITNSDKYLEYSMNSWRFVKQYILDSQNGEWHWGIKEDHSVIRGEDKVGIWKCPYHNARACIEIISRIESIGDSL